MFTGEITNAPHVPRWRAFFDSRAMIRNPLRVFERYRHEFGPTFTFHFGGTRGAVVSACPRFIRHVLQTNHRNYHMSHIRVKRMAEFQGHGLLNSHGERWLSKRRFLSRGFRRGRLADLLPVQQAVLRESMNRFDAGLTSEPVDIHRLMVGFTFRLVGNSLFGVRLSDAEIDELGSAITTIQEFMVRQIVQPYKIPWFRISGQTRRHQRMRREAEGIARDYIEDRAESGGDGGGDLLELLLESPLDDSGVPMSRRQMLIELMQLLVAGNETSPVALSWTLDLLGRHPRFIGEMRSEIDAIFGDGPITLRRLHQLDLTSRVLDEGMRLYPSFWMIDRVALDDDEVDGIRIPGGLTVLPYIYGLHRNPEVWDDPDTFDPSRFETEARKERHPFAHIPFGGGPRKCIGSRMGLMQMLLILAEFVRRYDFEPASDDPVELAPMMILHPRGGIEMRVRPTTSRL